MPFPEVVEPPKVGTGPLKEAFENGSVIFRASNKMRSRASRIVNRKIDNPKIIRRHLLTHQDTADLTFPGVPQAFPKARALITWKTDRDHHLSRAAVREAA